ncbi:MAG TPA: DUF6691 family protein [Solirubrobacteraceae bacterium]
MRDRSAGLAIGVVFGLILCWAGMAAPDVIRGALLFEDSYLYLMFASAVATSSAGLWLVGRKDPARTPRREPVQRRHVTGSVLFGVGWGVADACPGPIATQVGMGVGWALFILAGTVAGVWLYLRRSEPDSEPAADRLESRPTAEVVSIRT